MFGAARGACWGPWVLPDVFRGTGQAGSEEAFSAYIIIAPLSASVPGGRGLNRRQQVGLAASMTSGGKSMRYLEGGCSCGAVRFALESALWVVACHCSICKKRTGSAFGISIPVDDHM